MSNNGLKNFIAELSSSLENDTFVKLTLGNYKGTEEHLQKMLVRLAKTKKGIVLMLQYKYTTKDIVKNYPVGEAVELIQKQLENGFRSGHLFTSTNDFQLDIGKRGTRLNKGKPTFQARPELAHDRKKNRLIDQNAYYLKALGITNDRGEILAKQQDKWKQINKFVEILSGLYDRSPLKNKDSLNIVDMGCGKGYLTFAAFSYFRELLPESVKISVTGVDTKNDLVRLSNKIAEAGGLEGLKFVEGTINDFHPENVDILIALHACDTATDDALYKGIISNAEIIVASPCCHREIRSQIKAPEMFKDIMKHQVMKERIAETLTDGIRSLLLEKAGYSTRLFEFVPTEHTPKNNMITASRSTAKDSTKTSDQLDLILKEYGVETQHLHKLLLSERP